GRCQVSTRVSFPSTRLFGATVGPSASPAWEGSKSRGHARRSCSRPRSRTISSRPGRAGRRTRSSPTSAAGSAATRPLPARSHSLGNRSGCAGEDGCERLVMAEDAGELWGRVLVRGAVPCGLGGRYTLRLEVCYPLHGNDITLETDAIPAGLGWCCALDKEF